MIKGFIFDLDGVLVDTVDYHFASWKLLAKQLNFNLNNDIIEQLKGISRMDSLKIVLKQGDIKASKKQMIKYAAQKNEWYLSSLKKINDNVVLNGVLPFIKKCQQEGIKLTVGSSSKNAKSIIAQTSLKDSFIKIIDGNDVINAKPDPEVFLKAVKAMNLKPYECIVFEDSLKGLMAAKSAGFRRLAIGDAHILHEAEFAIKDLTNIYPKQIIKLFK